MTEQQFKKIGIFKCGNIGTSPLLELLLDELADRKDVKIRTVTTGSKMALCARALHKKSKNLSDGRCLSHSSTLAD